MKKRKKQEEHVDEAWLLPYSDMLTLLLALFIVMFASAKVDDQKFQEIKSEFGSILSSHSHARSDINDVIDLGASSGSKKEEVTTPDQAKASEALTQSQLENKRLSKISEQLSKDLAQSELKDDVQVSLEVDGIHITLDSNILFTPGSANITPSIEKSLNTLSPYLKKLEANSLTIAGHTDNIPENGNIYASNWELSAARAITVMNFFVNHKVIHEKNVAIQAYADTKPKAPNDSEAGRSQNRRVEMIIERQNEMESNTKK